MSEYDDGFDSKPSRSEAPDTCQYGSCDDFPEMVVRFREPEEYLCYCYEHTRKIELEMDVKYASKIV